MNATRRRIGGIAWSVCAVTFVCAAAVASAQSIHKEVDAAGHVTYTNRPRPTPPPAAAVSPADDVSNALATNTALSSRLSATIDAKEAVRRLRQAQQKREQSANRQPGWQSGQTGIVITDERYLGRRLNETRQSQH